MKKKDEFDEGLSASDFFLPGQGITYDGFILNPGIVDFAFSDISLETNLTRNIIVKV